MTNLINTLKRILLEEFNKDQVNLINITKLIRLIDSLQNKIIN